MKPCKKAYSAGKCLSLHKVEDWQMAGNVPILINTIYKLDTCKLQPLLPQDMLLWHINVTENKAAFKYRVVVLVIMV